MRIGFASIYAWRPHVEHMAYLARLAREAGHETKFLTCDADLPSCYGREMRPEKQAWQHCSACRIGGIRSFEAEGVTSIGELARGSLVEPAPPLELAASSAGTIGRFEAAGDFDSPAFREIAGRLEAASRRAQEAAGRWIERERLDAVCVFNGRMDATRGIGEAAQARGVRFVSLERTWFGDGLQLLPDESCLGLRTVDRMMREWRDTPLNRAQALRAVGHPASRFLRRNGKEWRAYNTTATATAWPVTAGRCRVLLTPSSRNEVWGHPDWASRWADMTDGFDALIQHLGLRPSDIVLRCHPNWSEKIGARDGSLSEAHFTGWARGRGIHVVASAETVSTLGLIEQADAIVVCGGSAALEAGILGKQVIAMSPSTYQQAGLQSSAYDSRQVQEVRLHRDLDGAEQARLAAEIARQTLRFCHTMVYRIPQFVDFVRSIETTRYEYVAGADPDRLTELVRSGRLRADDDHAAADGAEEGEVLEQVRMRAWNELARQAPPAHEGDRLPLRRRWMFRPVDKIRSLAARGDR